MINFSELNNNVKISISYITNFQPSLFKNFNSTQLFSSKNKLKIISKNFFLFLLLLKYNNSKNKFNIKLFIKPNYKKFITLLRAPYRYKLARHQFLVNRFYIIMSLKINFNKIVIYKHTDVIYLINLFKTFYV